MLQKEYFSILAFFGQKQQKLSKNEENWLNPNRSMEYSEIWNVDTF